MWGGIDALKDFIDKTSEQNGTPINRENMMAVQGFIKNTIRFSGNQIIETNANNEILTTTFEGNKIVETFRGEKIITKTTTFSGAVISEVVS